MPTMPFTPHARLSRLEDLRVRDLMTENPVSVRHGITVREAAVFLTEQGIGAAPVVNDAGRAIGVLSRSDVLLAVNAGVEGAPVREVMTPGIIAVHPEAHALQVSEIMVRCMVRRVFVVDDDGVPVGVVSLTDLFRGLMTMWGEAPAPVA
jgi:predicted transcriptional regulator